MTKSNAATRLRIVFVPQHVHSRVAMHSFAGIAGAIFAARMSGGSWLTGLAWYVGSFIGAHFAMIPFVAGALIMRDRLERWVRGVVEEELIRFDLQTYERQLQRVFPSRAKTNDDEAREYP